MAAKKQTKARKVANALAARRAKTKTKAKKTPAAAAAPAVSRFMTKSVVTIGPDQPLSLAHQVMSKHRIRHLPVLEAGELVGLVSQRDLYFIEALDGANPAEIRVDEAMTRDVFEVEPNTPLAEVARRMIRTKQGCAVITRRGEVIGMFSTIDGLEALLEYLPG